MNKKDLYAVILAGGSGTRFWPLSRARKPKQFLALATDKSLLSETVRRVRGLIDNDRVIIVASAQHKAQVLAETKALGVPAKNILWEPKGKNTAPAVCWAAAVIHDRNPDALMAVLPSDHLILKKQAFQNVLRKGFQLAGRGFLVTLGIVPTRPETGYGYLNVKKEGGSFYKVVKFIEKPALPKAKQFFHSKNYLWNSGMFIWETRTILAEFKQHLPAVYKPLSSAPSAVGRFWNALPSISVDYGIMERSKRVAALPAQGIGWSDVGSWQALWEVLKKDKDGNIFKGLVQGLAVKNSLVLSPHRLTAVVGVEDLIVVDTKDALLICPLSRSQEVKGIVDILKQKKNLSLV